MPPFIHTPALAAAVWPYSLADLRRDNPNVSFSVSPTADDLASFDVYEVQPTDQPTSNTRTTRLEEDHPELMDGMWQQRWTVRDASAEEIAAYDEANKPAPDWAAFKSAAQDSDTLKGILLQAFPKNPVASLALVPALERAEMNGSEDFAARWSAVCSAAKVPTEVIEGFQAVAEACHLPAKFIAALSPNTPE